MTAISNRNIKSSKGIIIKKGDKVELNDRENKFCDITKEGKTFTTTVGIANKYFNWTF